MIKINLIPAKRKKKPKPVPPFLVAMILLLLFSGIAVGYYNSYKAGEVEKLENQKAANAQKLKELEKRVQEVKNYESLNQQVKQRRDIIEQLTLNQSLPVRILDEMSNRLTDGVWITTMTISGNRITLAGNGFTNTDIVSFVQSLKASELFTNVELHGTTRKPIEGVETYGFNLTLEVKG
jgi:type IV pilus assembly protein PilN